MDEFLAACSAQIATQLCHLPRQDSLRALTASLETPARAAVLEPFRAADRQAIKGALEEAAGLDLLKPANRIDVRRRLMEEGHEGAIDAEEYAINVVRRQIEADTAQRRVPYSVVLRDYMAGHGPRVARCGEHARFMEATLERRGFPPERLLVVKKKHGRADHAVLLVSPRAPFDGGRIVPDGGALVIDTWAAFEPEPERGPGKLAFVKDDQELERHLGQALLQVDPTLTGPGQPVKRRSPVRPASRQDRAATI